MKAKIKETGEIVDVYHEPQHGQITNIYKESVFVNGRIWTEDELEFIESKEVNVDKSEDYKRGYQDALAYIRSEIEKRIAEKEKFLEQFPLEDLWHSGDEDPEEGRLIVSVYAFENCYIERATDALELEHIEKWCYLEDLL